jgi:hypothetical protein
VIEGANEASSEKESKTASLGEGRGVKLSFGVAAVDSRVGLIPALTGHF